MTKLHSIFLGITSTVANVEALQAQENNALSRIEKKKFKLQKEAELIGLEENFRSLKLQLLRDFKQELKTLGNLDTNDDDNNDDNK